MNKAERVKTQEIFSKFPNQRLVNSKTSLAANTVKRG